MFSFSQIPANLLIPGAFGELDDSQLSQGLVEQKLRVVLLGHKLAAGSAAAATLARVNSKEEAKALFGRGSMLARMAEVFKANDKTLELFAVPVAEPAGVAATLTSTFTGPATAAGTIYLRVCNQPVTVAVTKDMTAAQIATAVAAAINANPDLPVTAASAAGVVTSTVRHVGALGNGLDIRVNYNRGEALPAGVTVVNAFGTPGTGVAEVAAALAAVANLPCNAFVHPFIDGTNLGLIKTECATRSDAMHMLDTISISAKIDTLSNHQSFGNNEDSEFSVVPGLRTSCSPAWEVAAGIAAQAMASAQVDPALPWTGLEVLGINVLPDRVQFSDYPENQYLLEAGIGTLTTKDGRVFISRLVTTSKTNSLGLADTSLRSLNAILTYFRLRYTWNYRLQQKYPRHKLGDDGGRYGANSKVVTPKTLMAEALAIFDEWEVAGYVENAAQFKADLKIERDANNKDRINMLLPPNLINQLLTKSTLIQPRL